MNSAAKKKPDKESWDLLTELYLEGVELKGEQRALFLQRVQKEQPDLSQELSSLLGQTLALDNFLENPPTQQLPRFFESLHTNDTLAPGTEISDFIIGEVLGYGSFATVYLATEKTLGREVALKISTAPSDEAKTIASLEHRSIVQVYSEHVDPKSGLRLICMQCVRGGSLDKIVNRIRSFPDARLNGKNILRALDDVAPATRPFTTQELRQRAFLAELDEPSLVAWLGVQIAEALAYAHSRDVLHLDVKPANILLNSGGDALLTDFNISIRKNLTGDAVPGQFGGTPYYMAPEQVAVFEAKDRLKAFAKVSAASDIYSLGKVIEELLGKQNDKVWRSPSRRNLHLNLAMATEAKAQRRFASVSDFAKALRTCLDLRTIERNSGPRAWHVRFSSKHPLIAISVMGALPQILAVMVGNAYTSVAILSQTTLNQQVWYHKANVIYTPFSYALISTLWFLMLLPIYRYMRDTSRFLAFPRGMQKLCDRSLRLPYFGMACAAGGWLPGSILYPLVINHFASALPKVIYLHFLANFLICGTIAMSYTYLFHQFIVLRDIYPRFWVGQLGVVMERAEPALKAARWIRVCLAMTMVAPLGGGLLVLVTALGPNPPSPQILTSVRFLLASLIGLGILGVGFAAVVGPRIIRCVASIRSTFFSGDYPKES